MDDSTVPSKVIKRPDAPTKRVKIKPSPKATSAPPLPKKQTKPHPAEPPKTWAYWDEPKPAAKPSRTLWRRLKYMSLGWLLVMVLALIVAVVVGVMILLRSDYIIPGVQIGSLNVGGLTTGEATALLESQWGEQGIVLALNGTEQAVVPEALGLSLDVDTAVQLAYRQGRSLDSLRALYDAGWQATFNPALRFEPQVARNTLEALAPQFEVAPQNADIRLAGGQVEAVPSVSGQALDVPATMAFLSQDPTQVLKNGRLSLILKSVPATRRDVSQIVTAANELLSTPVIITAYDPIADEMVTREIAGEAWANWVSVWLDEESPAKFGWQLDEEAAQAGLADLFQPDDAGRYLKVDEAGPAIIGAITEQSWQVKQRLYHAEREHEVQPGETLSSIGFDYGIPYPWIEQANPGLERLSPGQTITIPSPDALLPLPIVENKRIVVSLSEQKAWVYENNELKWEWAVSTGIKSSPTAPGVFQVQSHQPNAYAASWDLWMPEFMGIYQPVPTADFMNGFHGFPTRNGSTLLWTDDLGHPVTYGCILLDSKNAAKLFNWAEAGVIVEIKA